MCRGFLCIRSILLLTLVHFLVYFFFFSSRRRHTRCSRDWSSDVCSSDLRSVKTVLLVANGDLRQSANQVCWPAQMAMEKKLAAAVAAQGCRLQRAHPYKPDRKSVV